MKKILLILPLFVFMYCTDTNQREKMHTTYIKNESGKPVEIKEYTNDELMTIYSLENNETSKKCEQVIEGFGGYGCGINKIIFKFNNGKGYLCDSRFTNDMNTLCFTDKSPLAGSSIYFKDIGNNTFEFVITEEDYNNAFELPE